MMNGLNGRRFLVCGGASGIGESTAQRLVQEGAEVVIADRDIRGLRGATMKQTGCMAFEYDQGDPTSVEELFANVTASGPLDGVAIVAGIHPGSIALSEITRQDLERVHGVNTFGVLAVLQHAVKSVSVGGNSSIVVVGSVAGIRPVARDAVYASSKASVQAITRSAALEYAGKGIRINAVLPGSALTPLALSQGSLDAIRQSAATTIPIGRAATSDEVASTICFLLSDDASHITATELIIDGGLAAGSPS